MKIYSAKNLITGIEAYIIHGDDGLFHVILKDLISDEIIPIITKFKDFYSARAKTDKLRFSLSS